MERSKGMILLLVCLALCGQGAYGQDQSAQPPRQNQNSTVANEKRIGYIAKSQLREIPQDNPATLDHMTNGAKRLSRKQLIQESSNSSHRSMERNQTAAQTLPATTQNRSFLFYADWIDSLAWITSEVSNWVTRSWGTNDRYIGEDDVSTAASRHSSKRPSTTGKKVYSNVQHLDKVATKTSRPRKNYERILRKMRNKNLRIDRELQETGGNLTLSKPNIFKRPKLSATKGDSSSNGGSPKSGSSSNGGSPKSGSSSNGGSTKSGSSSNDGSTKSGSSSNDGSTKSGSSSNRGKFKSGSSSNRSKSKSGPSGNGKSKSGSSNKGAKSKSGSPSKGAKSKSGNKKEILKKLIKKIRKRRTPAPTESQAPTGVPSPFPSGAPTRSPAPSSQPSPFPSAIPSTPPSIEPSGKPSASPSVTPTSPPSQFPSVGPSSIPSNFPTLRPSPSPSNIPSPKPSQNPSPLPT